MTKKVLITSAVGITMLAGLLAPSAFAVSPEGELPDTVQSGQVYVAAGDVDSRETDAVEESPMTQGMLKAEKKKPGMTQAEKKRNAETNDKFGGGITIIAMSIVVSALAVLSILFFIFGKISSKLLARKKQRTIGETAPDGATREVDSGETIAAIGMALAEHLYGSGHDLERTILTLRRMKRAYSPWNSKIYNIRHVPEQPVSKNRL